MSFGVAAMKLRLAYVQSENGIPAADSFYRAWDGFRKRGVRCELFEPKQLEQGELPLSRDTLVAGGVPVVEAALTALGVTVPPADNLPACLAKYRGRKVWTSTWGELRAKYGRTGPPESREQVRSGGTSCGGRSPTQATADAFLQRLGRIHAPRRASALRGETRSMAVTEVSVLGRNARVPSPHDSAGDGPDSLI